MQQATYHPLQNIGWLHFLNMSQQQQFDHRLTSSSAFKRDPGHCISHSVSFRIKFRFWIVIFASVNLHFEFIAYCQLPLRVCVSTLHTSVCWIIFNNFCKMRNQNWTKIAKRWTQFVCMAYEKTDSENAHVLQINTKTKCTDCKRMNVSYKRDVNANDLWMTKSCWCRTQANISNAYHFARSNVMLCYLFVKSSHIHMLFDVICVLNPNPLRNVQFRASIRVVSLRTYKKWTRLVASSILTSVKIAEQRNVNAYLK